MISKKKFIRVPFTILREEIAEGYDMPYSHYHDDYEIYLLTNGERTVSIDAITYQVSVYDATLFAPNAVHHSKGDSPYSGICIHFSSQYLKQYFTEDAIHYLVSCFQTPVITLSPAQCQKICLLTENFTPDSKTNFVLLSSILSIFCETSTSTESKEVSLSVRHKKQDEIIAYVEDNFTDIENISELANRFQVSERYIFKIFKQKYSHTPKQHINKLRIKGICYYLAHTDATIKHIAAIFGYNSYEYFYKVFLEEMHYTPSKYRQMHNRHK